MPDSVYMPEFVYIGGSAYMPKSSCYQNLYNSFSIYYYVSLVVVNNDRTAAL